MQYYISNLFNVTQKLIYIFNQWNKAMDILLYNTLGLLII